MSSPDKDNICLIQHFLENSARLYPDKKAVFHGDEAYTYVQIEEKSNKVANFLLDIGIQKGDRCVILLRNSIDYISSYYGALKAGAITVPMNTGLNVDEMMPIFTDCSPKVLISESFFKEKIYNIINNNRIPVYFLGVDGLVLPASDNKHVVFSLDEVMKKYSSAGTGEINTCSDPASIIYTSGSTGKPKGVVLSHLNIVSNTKAIVEYLRLDKDDKIMLVLPFYYVYGKSLLNTHFYAGAAVVIDNRFIFPNLVLKTIVEKEVTGFSGVPSTYSILLNKSNIRKVQFPGLRYLTQAGGHMAKPIKEELLSIFPDKEIFIMYGATEASARLSYLQPEKLSEKMDSIGKAIPGVELKLVKEDGSMAVCGEKGEIIARGTNIMLGYWNDPEETDKVLKDGWYYTGDIAVQDEEGFINIVGRKRDLIKVGIHKVSTKEIEDVLYRHETVHEVAVVGCQDEVLGEALKAYIVLNDNYKIGPEDLKVFCETCLPDYKIPKQIVFLDELPKNESGKIMKHKLSQG